MTVVQAMTFSFLERVGAERGFERQAINAVLIALGVAATLAGMWEHKRVLAAVSRNDYRYTDRPPIARYMGMALVVVGLAALALMLVHFAP